MRYGYERRAGRYGEGAYRRDLYLMEMERKRLGLRPEEALIPRSVADRVSPPRLEPPPYRSVVPPTEPRAEARSVVPHLREPVPTLTVREYAPAIRTEPPGMAPALPTPAPDIRRVAPGIWPVSVGWIGQAEPPAPTIPMPPVARAAEPLPQLRIPEPQAAVAEQAAPPSPVRIPQPVPRSQEPITTATANAEDKAAPRAAPIDTDHMRAVMDNWLTTYKIPEYRGALSQRTYDSIREGAAQNYLKDKYGVPDVGRAIYVEKTIAESEYRAAQDASNNELRRRGYTRGPATQESVFEPAPGVTPRAGTEYPYASVVELLNAAFKYAVAEMGLELRNGGSLSLRADTQCVRLASLMAGFINAAKGASSAQRRLALQQISSSMPAGGGIMPLHAFLAARGVLCLQPVSPEEVATAGYRDQFPTLVEALRIANVTVRYTRPVIHPLAKPISLSQSLYDSVVSTAVARARAKWAAISPELRTREVAGDAEWRSIMTDKLSALNIYPGAVPAATEEAYQPLTAEATERVLRVVIRDFLDTYGVPRAAGSLSSKVYDDAVGTAASAPAYNVLATVHAYPGLSPPTITNAAILRASDSEIRELGRTRPRCMNRVERAACERARTMIARYAPAVLRAMGYTRAPASQAAVFVPAPAGSQASATRETAPQRVTPPAPVMRIEPPSFRQQPPPL